jgi:hypothetical protein
MSDLDQTITDRIVVTGTNDAGDEELSDRMTRPDKHDSSAVVIAIDEMPGDDPGQTATGHIEFTAGIAGEQVGTLANVGVPR